MNQWQGFRGTKWKNNIDVESFILDNYKEYTGDETFLCGPTKKTKAVNDEYNKLSNIEIEKGVYDVETKIISGINNFEAG
ncbi:MAG: formate acetyltransferase, partial [Bacilli bacterium]